MSFGAPEKQCGCTFTGDSLAMATKGGGPPGLFVAIRRLCTAVYRIGLVLLGLVCLGLFWFGFVWVWVCFWVHNKRTNMNKQEQSVKSRSWDGGGGTKHGLAVVSWYTRMETSAGGCVADRLMFRIATQQQK